jgi:hypothetical protein
MGGLTDRVNLLLTWRFVLVSVVLSFVDGISLLIPLATDATLFHTLQRSVHFHNPSLSNGSGVLLLDLRR